MDARLVWDTWRRILTDDRLVTRILDPGGATDNSGLSPDELAVVEDYACTRAATDTNIGMYRAGLVRNALAAMSLVPMSQQLLYTSGLDVEVVAADYVRADGYRDHGPYFWRIAGGFVAHMADRAEFSAAPHRDVLALDAATIALARRLSGDPDAWAMPIMPRARAESAPIVASRAAVVVRSAYNLTPWIVHPRGFDPAEPLTATTHHWLVYFSAPDAEHGYSELSERAVRVFDLLSVPRTLTEVARTLELGVTETLEIIYSLAAVGVVGAAPALAVAHVPR